MSWEDGQAAAHRAAWLLQGAPTPALSQLLPNSPGAFPQPCPQTQDPISAQPAALNPCWQLCWPPAPTQPCPVGPSPSPREVPGAGAAPGLPCSPAGAAGQALAGLLNPVGCRIRELQGMKRGVARRRDCLWIKAVGFCHRGHLCLFRLLH